MFLPKTGYSLEKVKHDRDIFFDWLINSRHAEPYLAIHMASVLHLFMAYHLTYFQHRSAKSNREKALRLHDFENKLERDTQKWQTRFLAEARASENKRVHYLKTFGELEAHFIRKRAGQWVYVPSDDSAGGTVFIGNIISPFNHPSAQHLEGIFNSKEEFDQLDDSLIYIMFLHASFFVWLYNECVLLGFLDEMEHSKEVQQIVEKTAKSSETITVNSFEDLFFEKENLGILLEYLPTLDDYFNKAGKFIEKKGNKRIFAVLRLLLIEYNICNVSQVRIWSELLGNQFGITLSYGTITREKVKGNPKTSQLLREIRETWPFKEEKSIK